MEKGKVVCWNCEKDFSSKIKSAEQLNHCPFCGVKLDHIKVLQREGYEDRGQGHLYPPETDSSGLPYQGWKIHISANPSEAYLLSEQLLPSLQKKGIYHKVIRDREWLKKEIKGEEDTYSKTNSSKEIDFGTNRHKTIVIYPRIAEHLSHMSRQFPGVGKKQFFVKCKKGEKVPTKEIEKISGEFSKWDLGKELPVSWINRYNINANQPNAQEILQELIKLIVEGSNVSLKGGPPIAEGQGNEKTFRHNGQETRIKFRYDIINTSNAVIIDDKKIITKKTAYLKNNDGWRLLKEVTNSEGDNLVIGPSGSRLKSYREVYDVTQNKYIGRPKID